MKRLLAVLILAAILVAGGASAADRTYKDAVKAYNEYAETVTGAEKITPSEVYKQQTEDGKTMYAGYCVGQSVQILYETGLKGAACSAPTEEADLFLRSCVTMLLSMYPPEDLPEDYYAELLHSYLICGTVDPDQVEPIYVPGRFMCAFELKKGHYQFIVMDRSDR